MIISINSIKYCLYSTFVHKVPRLTSYIGVSTVWAISEKVVLKVFLLTVSELSRQMLNILCRWMNMFVPLGSRVKLHRVLLREERN
jgi:hypothetical protein